MKFQQIKQDILDFGDVVVRVRNSSEVLEIDDSYKDHPEIARAVKVDSLRVVDTIEPPAKPKKPIVTQTPTGEGKE